MKHILVCALAVFLVFTSDANAQYNSRKKPAGYSPEAYRKYYGGNNSGLTPTKRGSRDALSDIRAGKVQKTQPKKRPKYQKYCSCQGGDTLSYGSVCMGGPSGRSGTYPLGNYRWTPACRHTTYN